MDWLSPVEAKSFGTAKRCGFSKQIKDAMLCERQFPPWLWLLILFFRASFRMWFFPSCVTQTVMRNCGRRIHTSTSAWNLVSREGWYFNPRRNLVHQWWLTIYLISAVPLRCVRGLHLSNNSSPDTPLHCLQQKERGELEIICGLFPLVFPVMDK